MDFLTAYLRSSRLDSENSLTGTDVEITVKLDGTALQCVKNDDGKIDFFKRSNSPGTPGTPLSDFDIILRQDYASAVYQLNQKEEEIPDNTLLNFEIFSDLDKHIITYGPEDFEGNQIILLSAYQEGEGLSRQQLEELASTLDIGVVPEVYNGPITKDEFEEMRRYATSDDSAGLFSWMSERFKYEGSENIEGFVLTFYDTKGKLRELKVNNPDFQSKLYAHLDEEETSKGTDYSDAIADFIIASRPYVKHVEGDTKEDRLISLLSQMIEDGKVKTFRKIGEKVEELFDEDSGATINTYIHPVALDWLQWEGDDETALKGLKFVMMVCQNIRKNPLWTTEEGLEELNSFLSKLYGDVA